jgi:hypothetical protein
MDMLLEFYLEDATVPEGLTPVVYELPWGVAADPAGYQWDGWAFLQRRDGVLPEHFFERLPPAYQQMPIGLHLELSWEGLSALEGALADSEQSTVGASFASLVQRLLSGHGRWVAAFWAPSNKATPIAEGDAGAVTAAVLASLRQGGVKAERGWVVCRRSPGEAPGEEPAAGR